MKERVKLVLEWERRWDAGEGDVNVAELCREFGISRETGYYWIRRYRAADHDVRAVIERSRRPLTSPSRVDEKLEDFIVETRKLFPKWGPQKLRDYMVRRWPQHAFPSASTMGEILKRRGLTRPRLRRGRASWALTQPFAECTGPNATWCVDFKGHFRTQDGVRCYPLTLIDAHSRYLLRCEGLLEPDGKAVQRIFDTAFTEFGLPAAIRSDNGPPFASVAAAGLSHLSVWWTRLGIRIERIQRWQAAAKWSPRALPPHAEKRCDRAATRQPARATARLRPVPARVQRRASTRITQRGNSGFCVRVLASSLPAAPPSLRRAGVGPASDGRQGRLHLVGLAPRLRHDRASPRRRDPRARR
ncbi:MAG: Mobile element protein [Myxococcaceae bacterium]|nr:Mobile element protein [Myxococcaceae bacterium]